VPRRKTWKPATNVTMRYVNGKHYPAVNIKVHRYVNLRAFADNLPHDELTDPEFPSWLRTWCESEDTEALNHLYDQACRIGVENMIQDAENIFKDDACNLKLDSYGVKAYQDGRSGGWLYVMGLPEPVEDWPVKLRKAWTAFAEGCESEIRGLEYSMAYLLYGNLFEHRLPLRRFRIVLDVTVEQRRRVLPRFLPTDETWHAALGLNYNESIVAVEVHEQED
jgi:hypothetical protein